MIILHNSEHMKANIRMYGEDHNIVHNLEMQSCNIGDKLILMSGGTSSTFLIHEIRHYILDGAYLYTDAIVVKIF